jgi:hypothetical protein
MAKFTKTMGDSRYSIELEVKETSTNISENTSVVSYTLKATKSSGSGYYTSNKTNPVKVSLDGSEIVNKKIAYDFTGSTPKTITLASGTKTITHNADGSKTIACSGYFKDAENSLGSATASGNLTLTQLHTPPIINTWTISEANPKLLNISVPSDTYVKGLSQIRVEITNANYYDDASFQKMSLYKWVEDDTNLWTEKIADLTTNPAYYVPTEAGLDTTLSLTLTDSKNGTSEIADSEKNYKTIDYTSLTLNSSSKREGQTSGQVSISCDGSYFNGTIGNKNQGGNYKPTIKYKFWKLGDTEPTTYSNTISSSSITTSNGIFSVNALNIGSTTESATNYFNPEYAYKIKIQVSDNFTTIESAELLISVGEATWTEYKDRVDFKKLTIQGVEVPPPTIKTGSGIITRDSGATIGLSQFYKCGKVVQLRLSITSSGSTSAGSDCFTGTINSSELYPIDNIIGVGYAGSSAILFNIRNNGTISARVVGATLTNNQNIGMGVTYLVN